eukprot:5074722-Pyramimonas_sp.AAC.1
MRATAAVDSAIRRSKADLTTTVDLARSGRFDHARWDAPRLEARQLAQRARLAEARAVEGEDHRHRVYFPPAIGSSVIGLD